MLVDPLWDYPTIKRINKINSKSNKEAIYFLLTTRKDNFLAIKSLASYRISTKGMEI